MLLLILFFFFSAVLKAEFSCDLEQIKLSYLNKNLLLLILSGEYHNDEDCISDAILHLRESKKGHLLVGIEGLIFDHTIPENNFAKGYENPMSYGFGAMYFYYHLFSSNESKHQVIEKFIKAIKSNPFLKKEWTDFLKYYLPKKTVYFDIDQLLKTIHNTINETCELDQSIYFTEKIKIIFILNFKEIIRDFIFHLVESIKTKHSGNNPILDLTIQSPLPILSLSNFENILLNARNYDMGKNIEKLYCEAIHLNKPLFIIVGSAHVSGLEIILKNSSQDRVPIVTRFSKTAYQLYKQYLKNDAGMLEKIPFLNELKNQYLSCTTCYKEFESVLEKLELEKEFNIIL